MKLYKDRYYLILSLISFLISFIIYNITKAPTVSFWDCGEFIATSYIMGIPHPPGNPLFILIGHVFTMLPIAGQIAVRVNLISVISSAASVFVAFWLILRLTIGNKLAMPTRFARIGLGIGALCGALIMGFSYTFWGNAVEAEVYGVAMLFMLVIAYIGLLWSQNAGQPGNNRLLLLISYLIWLSLGIHPTTFIIALPLVLYLAYVDYLKNNFENWPVWVVMSLYILYLVPIQTQIFSIFGIDISKYELDSFFILMALIFAASFAMIFISRSRAIANTKVWVLTSLVLVFAALAYSTQAYIPLRASEKPAINENDPDDWPSFKAFLERKQYGQESMITRMFHRRASWQNQFISHPSFGLWHWLTEQYASPVAKLTLYEKTAPDKTVTANFSLYLWIIYVLIFAVIGISEAIKRSPPEGAFIVFAMLLCTVGLVFYLNFSDGTFNKVIAPVAEVRDRDYFYTPGFMLYAILIGVGLSAFLEWISRAASDTGSNLRRKLLSKLIFALTLTVAIYLPIHTAFANFEHNDRRGNWIPWDYAYNILQSCDKGAVLFTNGDNDTFPLWFIQQVDKVRTDVKVANLSLLNTPWYIHQLKDQMHVPISMNDKDIDNVHPVRFEGQQGYWRIQDLLVKDIIETAQAGNWQIPVYFSMTVAGENKLGLDDHLIQEGMAQRVVESTGKDRIEPAVGGRLFGDMSHLRGLADSSVRKDDNERRLILNYVAAIFQLVETYQEAGKPDSAIKLAQIGVKLASSGQMWQAQAILAKLYFDNDRPDKFESLISALSPAEGERVCLALAQDFITRKNFEPAIDVLKMTLAKYPASFMALNNLAMIYYKAGNTAALDQLISKFRDDNHKDTALIKQVDDMVALLQKTPPALIGNQ
jgi:tetratricopeptide (TPR) repeat protein